jgi:hypothetical protein
LTLAWRRTIAELAGRRVQVRMAESNASTWLSIEGHGVWAIDRASGRIDLVEPAPDCAATTLALEGPVRLLAMAELGSYAIHAAALGTSDGGLAALTAPSGVGKSTFAALARTMGRERAADDLLPIGLDATESIVARPHLAQPKLGPSEQYPPHAPAERALRALVRLERGKTAAWNPLPAKAAMDLVLRSTVATRIYTRSALASHLAFCRRVAEAVRDDRIACGTLTVADRPGAIVSAVSEALTLLDAALAR